MDIMEPSTPSNCGGIPAIKPRPVRFRTSLTVTVLASSVWRLENPTGNGSVSLNGSQALISGPANSAHNLWVGGNQSACIVQSVQNGDFQVQAEFDSAVNRKYQMRASAGCGCSSAWLPYRRQYQERLAEALNRESQGQAEFIMRPAASGLPDDRYVSSPSAHACGA